MSVFNFSLCNSRQHPVCLYHWLMPRSFADTSTGLSLRWLLTARRASELRLRSKTLRSGGGASGEWEWDRRRNASRLDTLAGPYEKPGEIPALFSSTLTHPHRAARPPSSISALANSDIPFRCVLASLSSRRRLPRIPPHLLGQYSRL